MTKNREAIRERCVVKQCAAQPSLPPGELHGGIDALLDEIVAALARAAESSSVVSPNPSEPGLGTGRRRRELRVSPSSVVHEISCLCDGILELASEHGFSVAPFEMQTLNRVVDEQIAAAIDSYWRGDPDDPRGCMARDIGVIAHELRNELNSASIAFTLIREGRAPLRGRTADVVVRALGRMRALITQTLAGARLDSAAPLNRERVRLDKLIRDVEAAHVPERGVRVRLQICPEAEILADIQVLSSAVSNLLQNALKFTKSCGTITVRGERRGRDTVIEVEDECGGLPSGAAERMFDPFVQGDNRRAGLGLGLTIARNAVKAHGGTLEVKDAAPKGCVFKLSVPS